MYQPVRNPYGQSQSAFPCCCVTFLVVLFTTVAIVGIHFASQNVSAPFMVVDQLRDPETVSAFNDFMHKYHKTYGNLQESSYRYRIFAENYKRINEFNANPDKTFELEANKFADLTDEEFKKFYLSKTSYEGPQQTTFTPSDTDVKADWRSKTTPVKDQGACGSCWTFSSISVVETLVAIKTNSTPERYSEQELVDCCRGANYPLSNGCNGGEEEDALKYIAEHGIVRGADYPYRATDNACKTGGMDHLKNITGHKNYATGKDLEEIIKTQTASVALAAGHFNFRFYKSGVLTEGCPNYDISHAVTLVGADKEDGKPYWLIRNSWGSNWGEAGHIRIMRTKEDCGLCGVQCYGKAPIFKQ